MRPNARVKRFASEAWLLEGLTVSISGRLVYRDERVTFTTFEKQVFDAPLSELSEIVYPWYYFGGGVKLKVRGEEFRLSFVAPNESEYAAGKVMSYRGNPLALLVAMNKFRDVCVGRARGRRWRRILPR